MREFRTAFAEIVDLDDPKTYEYLPQDRKELDNMMFCEIGQALVYMYHFKTRRDMFTKEHECGWKQRIRVNILIQKWADERSNNYENTMWIQEQIFIFQDETENMC